MPERPEGEREAADEYYHNQYKKLSPGKRKEVRARLRARAGATGKTGLKRTLKKAG